MKDLQRNARIPINKIRSFVSGKGVAILRSDLEDASNEPVQIMFSTSKAANRFTKNLGSLGKKFLLRHNDINDVRRMSGGSIFDPSDEAVGGKLKMPKLKSITKAVGKFAKKHEDEIANLTAAVATTAIAASNGEATGQDVQDSIRNASSEISHMAKRDVARQAGVKEYNYGQYKTGGKLKINKQLSKLTKTAVKKGKKFVKAHESELTDLGQQLAAQSIAVANGEGSVEDIKNNLASSANQIQHMAKKDVANKIGVAYQYGQYAPQEFDETFGATYRGGSIVSTGLGGSRLLNNTQANPQSVHERMAHARSFKKSGVQISTGGSFKPLGGSFKPLGRTKGGAIRNM